VGKYFCLNTQCLFANSGVHSEFRNPNKVIYTTYTWQVCELGGFIFARPASRSITSMGNYIGLPADHKSQEEQQMDFVNSRLGRNPRGIALRLPPKFLSARSLFSLAYDTLDKISAGKNEIAGFGTTNKLALGNLISQCNGWTNNQEQFYIHFCSCGFFNCPHNPLCKNFLHQEGGEWRTEIHQNFSLPADGSQSHRAWIYV
jgi:hypothetical protein